MATPPTPAIEVSHEGLTAYFQSIVPQGYIISDVSRVNLGDGVHAAYAHATSTWPSVEKTKLAAIIYNGYIKAAAEFFLRP